MLGRVQHTHFATYTAGIAVGNALAGEHRRYSLGRVPGAIFTDPEIATVGLTADEAQAQGRKVKVGKQEMARVGRARAMGETRGFVKFVVDAETDELLGMHVLAYHGADLLAQGVIAMNGTGTLAPLTRLRLRPSDPLRGGEGSGRQSAAGRVPGRRGRPAGALTGRRQCRVSQRFTGHAGEV